MEKPGAGNVAIFSEALAIRFARSVVNIYERIDGMWTQADSQRQDKEEGEQKRDRAKLRRVTTLLWDWSRNARGIASKPNRKKVVPMMEHCVYGF